MKGEGRKLRRNKRKLLFMQCLKACGTPCPQMRGKLMV